MRVTAYFEPAPPRILAHRGLALDAPENTLAAFRAALDAGATHLETDAHATADGVAVLWHDPTLARFDLTEREIARERWPSLQRLESRGQTLTTVPDALTAFPEARFNIDIKTLAVAVPVAEAVLAAGATDRVLLTSFSEARARAAWRLVPGVAKSATSPRMVLALFAIEFASASVLRRALDGIDAIQVPERRLGLTLTHEKRLRAFRRHVREVHVWTVNDPADMVRLWHGGVDGIVTDRTDLAVAARASIA